MRKSETALGCTDSEVVEFLRDSKKESRTTVLTLRKADFDLLKEEETHGISPWKKRGTKKGG